MGAALVCVGILFTGLPAFADGLWADAALRTAASLAIESQDKRGEYDEKEAWVGGAARMGGWLGEGIGAALAVPVGVVSLPVWLGVAAASDKFEAPQAVQLSLMTGGAVHDACVNGGYHAFGAPLSRVSGPRKPPAKESRLPPSKLRP
jgi:hypothetical protein